MTDRSTPHPVHVFWLAHRRTCRASGILADCHDAGDGRVRVRVECPACQASTQAIRQGVWIVDYDAPRAWPVFAAPESVPRTLIVGDCRTEDEALAEADYVRSVIDASPV